MKKLLAFIALFFFTSTAFSQEVITYTFEAKNTAGGRIVLETTQCYNRVRDEKFPALMNMYSVDKNDGGRIYGCWIFKAGHVKVIWDDGTSYMYDPGDFIPTNK